ncbi:hypothetical protein Tco_0099324, partial [Tanacetum coccineum]
MVRKATRETNVDQQKSFANILSSEKATKKVNFRKVDFCVEDSDCVLPLANLQAV